MHDLERATGHDEAAPPMPLVGDSGEAVVHRLRGPRPVGSPVRPTVPRGPTRVS